MPCVVEADDIKEHKQGVMMNCKGEGYLNLLGIVLDGLYHAEPFLALQQDIDYLPLVP